MCTEVGLLKKMSGIVLQLKTSFTQIAQKHFLAINYPRDFFFPPQECLRT